MRMPTNVPSSLAGAIFESCAKSKIPTDEALEFMKNEIQERFALSERFYNRIITNWLYSPLSEQCHCTDLFLHQIRLVVTGIA